MTTTIPDLQTAIAQYRTAAKTVVASYAARRPDKSAQVTPESLATGLGQFFTIAQRLEGEAAQQGPASPDHVSQLGDYGLTLLVDLAAWAGQLGLSEQRQALEALTLPVADWVVRHGGELRALEAIVDRLAYLANHTKDPARLESLCQFMTRIVNAASALIRQDLEKSNSGRPWRVLQLNRAIVATRTHKPALMERVFDELTLALPEDAPRFFAEGMQQMDALNYPPHVRAVMSRYFDHWTRRTMN